MSRSDFVRVSVDEKFDAQNQSATKSFSVEGTPTDGYLLIQALDVESSNHQISINNQQLGGFDIPRAINDRWFLWLDRIPGGFLQSGTNTITIERIGDDDFAVRDVVVHWREAG